MVKKYIQYYYMSVLKEIKDLKKILLNHIKEQKKLGSGIKKGVPIHVVLGEGFPKIRLKKGDGIYDSLKSAYNTTKDVVKKIYSGDTGMPPNIKKILEKYGNQYIKDIKIVRNPVSSAIINALNVASMGAFKKNLNDSPYDKLFHLKLILELQNGIKISFEKVERVSLTINPKPVKGEEEINVPVNKMITLNEMYNNTFQRMGNLFYPYSAKNNNCQNFALNILEANNLAGEREKNFVKQDTEELFGDDSFIRKLSNTVTDIGARFNVLKQGGKIGVYPAMYDAPDFIKLPPYLQNQALAEDASQSFGTVEEQGGNVDFENINWGSFKKAFYNRQPKYKHLRTLKEYAMYIIDHPENFTKHTKHRANFYLNILKK